MKAQFLKLAGVKSEKEFYSKFPDEKSFMAKHGKEVKKLQSAANGINYQFGQQNYAPGQLGYNLSGDQYKPMFNVGAGQQGMQRLNSPSSQQMASNIPTDFNLGGGNGLGKLTGLVDLPGKIVKGIQNIKEEKKARKSAETWENVSKVNLDASRSKDIDTNRQLADNMTKKRQMMMPVNTGEEFFPIYGVGTENLSKNGKKIKGQIQNTYAPKTLYDDLGYAAGGTAIPGMDIFGQATSMAYGENAGSQLGGDIGSIFGPIGSEIGKFAGYALDQNPERTKRAQKNMQKNVDMMGMNSWGKSIQGQNQAFMQDGGTSPQVINRFGNHTMRDLLRPDPTMDTLRAGGHLKEYTPPLERALQTFDMGGDLQVHSGGYMEPISDNPYAKSPTVMFRGQSHDESDGKGRSGIQMTYGNSPVEVERGEPAQEFADGEQEKSLVVFGNLPISNTLLPLLGDPTAKGKKFKNYIADLSKKEAIQNKVIDKSTKAIDDLDPKTPFEKLTFASHTANIKGAGMNQEDLAQRKETAAALQQAVNEAADEHGLVADDLAKGNVKYAKLGTTLHKAEDGKRLTINPDEYSKLMKLYEEAEKQGTGSKVKEFQDAISLSNPDLVQSIMSKFGGTNLSKKLGVKDPNDTRGFNDSIFKERTRAAKPMLDEALQNWKTDNKSTKVVAPDPYAVTDEDLKGFASINKGPMVEYPEDGIPRKEKFDWMKAIGSMMPYLRPTDAEPLEGRQLAGEMFAMANNQQEPVPLQTFQPQLTTPYDVSHQDMLNENQATFRSAQRMAGANPVAQANIAAQQYQANQRVLGEQFRQNQAMKNQTYAQNRQALDQAQLRNLQAYDQQVARQSQAKSNTKEVTQAALNSISDKFLKNQLSNRTLQIYENMYNYRFDPRMRAQNWNGPAQFDTSGAMARAQNSQVPEGMVPTWESDEYGNPEKSGYKKIKSRNGSIVSSFKNL